MAESIPAYFPKVRRPRRLWQRVHGVVEAVHYAPDGRVAWVRAYPRRWVHYADRVQMSREELIARLQRGERWFLGQRQRFLGSDGFTLGPQICLTERQGQPYLVLSGQPPGERELAGAPEI